MSIDLLSWLLFVGDDNVGVWRALECFGKTLLGAAHCDSLAQFSGDMHAAS